ncbi:MAG: restriction endonuclease subunit S [Sandaracinaceae bacterium]|nr:restriction endonuclease subunit S [Sandaracinaceae bacterium]
MQAREFHRRSPARAQEECSGESMAKIRIPVPPLAVQEEIVRVLDLFAALEAELEAELEARRRQYAYYRDSLLTFTDAAEGGGKMDDIGGFRAAELHLVSRSPTTGAGVGVAGHPGGDVDIQDTEMRITEKALSETAAKRIPENCVITRHRGLPLSRSAINKIPLTTNQHCCNFEIDQSQAEYRYVFHWVSSHYEDIKSMGRGARADLNASLIKGFKMPVPPLGEQRRIVAILDQFDALVNDLSDGLPAEIRARRQQYETYRDQLLSYVEAAA